MKRFISIVLCLITLLSTVAMVGCESTGDSPKGPKVNVEDLYVPTYKDDKHIILGADMTPDFSVRANLEQYKEAGFDTIWLLQDFFNFYDANGKEKMETVLKWCEEDDLDMDVYIRILKPYYDEYPDYKVQEPIRHNTYFDDYLSDIDFHDYPKVIGFDVIDEPYYKHLYELKESYVPWFNENYGGEDSTYKFHLCLFGGLSYLVGQDYDGTTVSYDQYVTFYIENVLNKINSKGNFLQMDCYPFKKNAEGESIVAPTWLATDLRMATYCKKYGYGLSTCVQAFEGFSGTELPKSVDDMRMLTYTDLAFGAKELLYFGYKETYEAGVTYPMMTTSGIPNPLYYYVQEINNEIKKFDHVLMAFDWQGVFTNVGSGNSTNEVEAFENLKLDGSIKNMEDEVILKKLTGVKSFASKYNAFVGEFKDADGNVGFMLQNYDNRTLTRKNKVTFKFENADGVLVYRKGEPIIEGLAGHEYTIELDNREGVFIIPLYKKK